VGRVESGVGIPGPRADWNGGRPTSGGSVKPFSEHTRDEPDEVVFLHIKILSTNAEERRVVAGAVQKQIEGLAVGKKKIVCAITDESVEINLGNLASLAAHIVPKVLKALGMGR